MRRGLASKLAAEKLLRESGLNWSIQRFGFVYGDHDGHLEMLPRCAVQTKWQPAQKMGLIHHRDIATAILLGLTGAMDCLVVNIVDEAPTSCYELIELLGETMAPSAQPVSNPWHLHVDGSLAPPPWLRADVRYDLPSSAGGGALVLYLYV